MTRIKYGTVTRRRRNKLFRQTKGYTGKRNNVYRLARVQVERAGMDAYVDRRRKKRIFRQLWIARLSAAVKQEGMNYSRFIDALNKAKVVLDRRILAELAVHFPEVFTKVVAQVRTSSK